MTKERLIHITSVVLDNHNITDEDQRQEMYLNVLSAAKNGSEFNGTMEEIAAKIEGLFIKPSATVNLNWGLSPVDITDVAKKVLSNDQYNITMLYFSNIDPELIARSFPGHPNVIGVVNDAVDKVRAAILTR